MHRLPIAIAIIVSSASLDVPVFGQPITRADLSVPEQLESLDERLREQAKVWLEARATSLAEDGEQTSRFWDVSTRLDPIRIHGHAVLDYARSNGDTPESLACLAYIIEWGEGSIADLHNSALDEVVLHFREDPATSSICSFCTNGLYLEENRSFLTRLRRESNNPTVQAAAAFCLAKLLDNTLLTRNRVAEIRENFEKSGAFEAKPDLDDRLATIESIKPSELENARNRLLEELVKSPSEVRPWSTARTFGRLDYRFRENLDATPYCELAKDLQYQVLNLREGCIAPDFIGNLVTGDEYHLKDQLVAPTLLVFSYKGCAPCEAMYPEFKKLQQTFLDDGFTIIAIRVDEKYEDITIDVDNGTITWPCIWDGPSGPISRKYRVDRFPTTLLLDKEGRIVARNLRQASHLAAYIETMVD